MKKDFSDYQCPKIWIESVGHPIKDHYDIIRGKVGVNIYRTIDLKSDYGQVGLSAETRLLMAFRTQRGLFQIRVMAFGANANPVFAIK